MAAAIWMDISIIHSKPALEKHTTLISRLNTHPFKGRFTSRGQARLDILTCDWSKGWNWTQPLYTQKPSRFGGMNFFNKKIAWSDMHNIIQIRNNDLWNW